MSSTAPGIGEEWDVLSGLLPQPDTGQPRRPDRVVLNGIVWKLRTDPGWRDVPERGVSPGGRCTHVSAGGCSMACSRSSPRGRRPKEGRPCRDGTRPGRSRVELTTKIHLDCDGPMPPLGFVVIGGNTNDCTQLEQVLAQIRALQPGSAAGGACALTEETVHLPVLNAMRPPASPQTPLRHSKKPP
ncbi:transposase [Streptomyces sp. NPDC102473]|uniref:transposase n=1 Tax=Streptomyces sp. NPDC102473 TaxID=3366180 RepID=UPI003821801C